MLQMPSFVFPNSLWYDILDLTGTHLMVTTLNRLCFIVEPYILKIEPTALSTDALALTLRFAKYNMSAIIER